MKRYNYGNILWFVFPLIFIIANILIIWHMWQDNHSIAEENGLEENLQIVFLVMALVIHLFRGLKESIKETSLYHLTLAIFCYSIMIRELDIDKFGAAGIWPAAEIIIRTIAVCAWIWIIYLVVKNSSNLWRERKYYLLSVKSVLIYTAIVLYISSWFFDKGYVGLNQDFSLFIEESLQFAGTVFFLINAIKNLPCHLETKG